MSGNKLKFTILVNQFSAIKTDLSGIYFLTKCDCQRVVKAIVNDIQRTVFDPKAYLEYIVYLSGL